MGVIKGTSNCHSAEQQLVDSQSQFINDNAESSAEAQPMVNSLCHSRNKRTSPKKWFEKYRQWDNARNIKKAAGVRQARRCENLNFLLNMAEQDEVIDVDVVDIVEPRLSAFAELFEEQEKMRIWNDFINCSEDEQESWLLQCSYKKRGICEDFDVGDDVEVVDMDDSWEQLDERELHPAYSAEECFQRIDHNLKSLLKKKHLPLGILQWIENEVTDFFTEWPNSVYISRLTSSFDRMVLHALCQYLDLYSQSYNADDGKRQTQVENRNQSFQPPDVSLSQFIEAKSNKR